MVFETIAFPGQTTSAPGRHFFTGLRIMVSNPWRAIITFVWYHVMKNKMDNPPSGQGTIEGGMAEQPYWVRGYIRKD